MNLINEQPVPLSGQDQKSVSKIFKVHMIPFYSLRRQAKVDEENLSGFYLQFYEDSTFNGNSGCNRISGRYSIKGSSIKFNNVSSTRMACERMEQEAAFMKLLEGTISAYTVSPTQLLLRDGSSNIVFTANRRE